MTSSRYYDKKQVSKVTQNWPRTCIYTLICMVSILFLSLSLFTFFSEELGNIGIGYKTSLFFSHRRKRRILRRVWNERFAEDRTRSVVARLLMIAVLFLSPLYWFLCRQQISDRGPSDAWINHGSYSGTAPKFTLFFASVSPSPFVCKPLPNILFILFLF